MRKSRLAGLALAAAGLVGASARAEIMVKLDKGTWKLLP